MTVTRRKALGASSLKVAAALFLSAIIASACQSPMVSSGTSSGNASKLQLSFKVLGTTVSMRAHSAKSMPSRLLLPTASRLAVTLTPLGSGLETPPPQSVPIPSSSGGQVVSVTFPDIAWGNYTISAVASDSGGVPQFRQNAALAVSEATKSATLNLVPAINSSSPVYNAGFNSFDNVNIAPESVIGYEIPAIALTEGSYWLTFSADTSVGFKFYVQNADGTMLESGDVDSVGYITTATETSVSSIQITPSSSSSPSYLTLYNPDTLYTASYIGLNLSYPFN